MSKIARFEALAEWLVEGTFARLFAGRLSPLEVATHLTRAMEDYRSPDGIPRVPTHYWVYVHPDDRDALMAEQPALGAELARHVAELAAQAGLALERTPTVRVVPEGAMALHQVRVEARWVPEEEAEVGGTREIEPGEGEEEEETAVPAAPQGRPFVVLDGRRHVDLLQPVMSIGRALDNDVIVEDPRVSRHHAQLRLRYGRYVLYDLGSSGGTQINGYPVEECVLQSGDVISFAGVQVIYGEDPPTPIPLPASSDTPPLAPQEIEPD